MQDNTIASLPKGAIPDVPDSRDFPASAVLGATPIDWSKEFRLPEPPNENQGSSLSCVSQAWSYFHWQLTGRQFSRRDLYSRIRLPRGAAYLRDGGKELTTNGQQTRQECADPESQNESNMSIRCANPQNALDDTESNYFLLPDSIDGIAQAIRDYKGCVFGVFGDNAGWSNLTEPMPPRNGNEWAHALYAFGYHMHNGRKCIIAKSSWCGAQPGHHEHHIKQNYFDAGRVFNAWVLIPKERLPMNQTRIVLGKDNKTVFKCTPISTDFENFKKQMHTEGINVPNPIPPSKDL